MFKRNFIVLIFFLFCQLIYSTSFAQYDPTKDPGLNQVRILQEEIARAKTPQQRNLLQRKLDELTAKQSQAEKSLMSSKQRTLQEQATLQRRANRAARQKGGVVKMRGLGGFSYGQTIIDIIANWEKFSLAAQKQYCYSWFGADSFEKKYGYKPTWQRILNFGYLTDEQLRDYLRQKLDVLSSEDNREAYINCLNVLQAKKS